MVDTLLNYYGLLVQNRRADFSRRVALLDSASLISLSIFRRLNVERNVVEHEYRIPSREKVSDAIDVCRLLRLAIERLGQDIPYEGIVGLRESGQHALMQLNARAGEIELWELKGPEVMTDGPFGTSFIRAALRSNGTRTPPDDELSVRPIRAIPLTIKNVDDWKPYMERVVALQASLDWGKTNARHDAQGFTFGFRVAVSAKDAAEKGLFELIRDHTEDLIQGAALVKPDEKQVRDLARMISTLAPVGSRLPRRPGARQGEDGQPSSGPEASTP
jgi:hypothetical protein